MAPSGSGGLGGAVIWLDTVFAEPWEAVNAHLAITSPAMLWGRRAG